MKDYIDRETAIEAILRLTIVGPAVAQYANTVCSILQELPTASVAQMVRCRECVHYREHRTKRHKQLIRECMRMARHDMEYPVKPDDFCSYGQRKEDEYHG